MSNLKWLKDLLLESIKRTDFGNMDSAIEINGNYYNPNEIKGSINELIHSLEHPKESVQRESKHEKC